MIGFSWAMVPPLPSKSTITSLSSRLSYSQLSFQIELVPTATRLSVTYFFHASRAAGFVKSQNAPGPPHQLPTAYCSGFLLSFTNTSWLLNSSNHGWHRRIPGLILGTFSAPLSCIAWKYADGSLKRVVFHVNTQRLFPTLVYPEERWKPSIGKPSSLIVSIKPRTASSLSLSSSG